MSSNLDTESRGPEREGRSTLNGHTQPGNIKQERTSRDAIRVRGCEASQASGLPGNPQRPATVPATSQDSSPHQPPSAHLEARTPRPVNHDPPPNPAISTRRNTPERTDPVPHRYEYKLTIRTIIAIRVPYNVRYSGTTYYTGTSNGTVQLQGIYRYRYVSLYRTRQLDGDQLLCTVSKESSVLY